MMLIHGARPASSSLERFAEHFGERGYAVTAPEWPRKSGDADASPALAHPSTRHGVVPLDLEEFTYGFVNTFPPDEAAAAFERYAVPETGRIFFEAGFANLRLHRPTEVDYEREGRAPLPIVGAGQDHTVPASGLARQPQEVQALGLADRLHRVRGPAPPDDGR